MREHIERTFNELQNTGRNLERWRAKTVVGFSTRVMAKITRYTLKRLLRRAFGFDVPTFATVAA